MCVTNSLKITTLISHLDWKWSCCCLTEMGICAEIFQTNVALSWNFHGNNIKIFCRIFFQALFRETLSTGEHRPELPFTSLPATTSPFRHLFRRWSCHQSFRRTTSRATCRRCRCQCRRRRTTTAQTRPSWSTRSSPKFRSPSMVRLQLFWHWWRLEWHCQRSSVWIPSSTRFCFFFWTFGVALLPWMLAKCWFQ